MKKIALFIALFAFVVTSVCVPCYMFMASNHVDDEELSTNLVIFGVMSFYIIALSFPIVIRMFNELKK